MAGKATLDLGALKVFLTVAATGNMTAAARALGMTQSAVSQIVQQLESGLGVALLDRAHRPLRLTAAGSILARRAERLVDEAEHLPAAVREASTVPEIRVGLVDSFAGTVGPSLIRAYMDRISTITLWAGLTPSITQALLGRQLDVIVTPEAMEDVDALARYPLLREPFVLALPRSMHGGRGALTLEMLAERHTLVRYSARSSIGVQIDRHLRRLGIAAPRRIEMDSSDTLFAMVAAGVGWAVTTPLCVLHGRPEASAVRLEPMPGPGFSRHLTMIARRGEYQELVDRLATTARQALRESCLPALLRAMPWIRDEFVVQPVQDRLPATGFRTGTGGDALVGAAQAKHNQTTTGGR